MPAKYLAAAIPSNERERLRTLRKLQLLDSPTAKEFDRITHHAAADLGVPIMLISLVDEHRQWFLSRVGLNERETPRHVSFCAHADYECRPLVVSDAPKDERFAGNPLVTGAPGIRAYAGIPLYTRGGYPLGTFCAIDTRARQFSERQMRALMDYTLLVEELIRARERSII